MTIRNRTSPLPKVEDKQTARALNQTKQSIDSLLRLPFPTGVLVQGIAVTNNTQFTVAHGLGRVWVGYLITRSYGSAVFIRIRDGAASSTPTSSLNLIPNGTGTIDVYVF